MASASKQQSGFLKRKKVKPWKKTHQWYLSAKKTVEDKWCRRNSYDLFLSKMSEKIQRWCTFSKFLYENITLFETFSSIEYNFCSIGRLLRLTVCYTRFDTFWHKKNFWGLVYLFPINFWYFSPMTRFFEKIRNLR